MNGFPDDSYKFGSGRVLIKQGLFEQCAPELMRYGKKPFIVGGPTAVSLVREKIECGLKENNMEGVFSVHDGHVYHEAARKKAEEGMKNNCDLVVAVGGGRGMDFGKLVASYMNTPVVCMPTSISTCAAFSPFSMIYSEKGQTIPGNYCYDLENSALLIDLNIMAEQPARYIVSGALDAMAKFVEIKNGFKQKTRADTTAYQYPGYLLAQYSFSRIRELLDTVLEDVSARRVTPAVEEMSFLNIPLTGVISAFSHGVGQSAIAHDLYYQTRLLFTEDVLGSLHGEIVGLGLIPQLYYNGNEDQAEPFRRFLEHVGAPCCLSQIGFKLTKENYERLERKMADSIYVGKDKASQERFSRALDLIRQ